MDLNSLILDNSGYWLVKNNFLMYRKLQNIPICFIEDDIFYVFLDVKLASQVLKLTKTLMKSGVEFYFTTTEYSNPKVELDYNLVISQYLYAYSRPKFFYGFDKIGFDLIRNLTHWMEKEKCFHLFKENYDIILKRVVNRNWYDYYSNKNIFDCELEIRDNFSILYRDIQINRII
jgi:hypothetical protein